VHGVRIQTLDLLGLRNLPRDRRCIAARLLCNLLLIWFFDLFLLLPRDLLLLRLVGILVIDSTFLRGIVSSILILAVGVAFNLLSGLLLFLSILLSGFGTLRGSDEVDLSSTTLTAHCAHFRCDRYSTSR